MNQEPKKKEKQKTKSKVGIRDLTARKDLKGGGDIPVVKSVDKGSAK